ncbi:hypothetical protein GGR52DRAFT_579465 [Hypoxylon sp. FL1284]|nr:hypothetical protein GGR52DRAFT_579465 [Hypoxylon sp. FL1284]
MIVQLLNRLPIRHSLSLWGCFIIFVGSFLTLIAVAFLIYLWATRLWRLVVLRGWAAGVVTLSSIVLHSVITAQATVCTSLVAALLIERRRVSLSRVAQMSITRSVNNGPQQLLQDIIASGSCKMIFNTETILLTVLAFGVLGIQFSSTILLSDFTDASLVQDSQMVRKNIALSPRTYKAAETLSNSTRANLQSSAMLFGERDSKNVTEPNEYGVSHNGPKQRAFLPFEHEDHIKMRYFKGAAFTLETEVSTPLCLPQSFNCSIPLTTAYEAPRWATAMCVLTEYGAHEPPFGHLYGPASLIFLVWATNGTFRTDAHETTLGPPTAYREWSSYEAYPGSFLNISLCFAAIGTPVSEVEMTSGADLAEPDFKWSPSLDTPSLHALQKIMGADGAHGTTDERGIFGITETDNTLPPTAFAGVNKTADEVVAFSESHMRRGLATGLRPLAGDRDGLRLCVACAARGATTSKDGAALLMQILNSAGGGVGVARLALSFYYLSLPLLDAPGDLGVPRRTGGLVAVLVVVAVSVVCVGAITVLYVRNVRYTRQGDFWHAVGQLVAGSTRSILGQSNELSDEKVAELLKDHDRCATINRSAQTGRVEVTEVC